MKRSRAKKSQDEFLLAAYIVAVVTGLIMIYSSSSILADSRFGSHYFFLRQQLMWAVMSGGVIYLIGKCDLKRLSVYSTPALFLTIVALMMVFLMPARNGSHRWLFFGPVTVQPSELFRFLLIVFLAFSLSNPRRHLSDWRQLLFPYGPLVGLGLVLILLEPDLGSTMVIGATTLGIFFLAGVRVRHLVAAGAPMIATASAAVFLFGYKQERVISYLSSVLNPLDGGYQVRQAALTLGSGGLFGVGLGDGRQKLFFLPYPHTDFIFASTGEEIGLVGLIAVLGLFFFIIYRGFKIAVSQPDKFGFLLAAGVTWALFINIAINIGVVTALLPVTGLPLPFLSYGGSSLMVSSASIGVLLNLSRRRAV